MTLAEALEVAAAECSYQSTNLPPGFSSTSVAVSEKYEQAAAVLAHFKANLPGIKAVIELLRGMERLDREAGNGTLSAFGKMFYKGHADRLERAIGVPSALETP